MSKLTIHAICWRNGRASDFDRRDREEEMPDAFAAAGGEDPSPVWTPEISGQYADRPRYVRTETGRYSFPSPAEIPALMGDFAAWLSRAPMTPETAFEAHRRLVDIHFIRLMTVTDVQHGF